MKNKTYNTINSTRKSDQKIYINHNKNREGNISVKNIVRFGTIQRFVDRNEHTDLRQGIRQFESNQKPYTTQQIQKIPFLKILKLKKPIKITRKPRQELQPDHNTKKIP